MCGLTGVFDANLELGQIVDADGGLESIDFALRNLVWWLKA
jgi:hypothetical protein